MKVVFVKVKDPIAWRNPSETFLEEDKRLFVCHVVRYAGLLIHETEDTLTIGEITAGIDNPKLKELIEFPRYRGVTIISKASILDRQEFEVKEMKEKRRQ